ncbi:uncharacterized protein K460DRAFT_81195 [Cucurbitaria berberidis CBS 394.84]|uniref:F-box domain-containing protein n=1 Tax=Cucurbitaria berberidis CBS 394.84 TaxID=1168544 RepID=A0A9P4GP87_9PLEO|nr:uncharacterized protein K460DRAFT_81195 [Cucurbitaria berberidis CBS 394.84]KAF1848817.1 hypothetical protein K460DRAFT_81195 [Cucurbitaria berberidis CBS 394.84]
MHKIMSEPAGIPDSSVQPSMHPQGFRLLDLPGELRNKIYSSCTENHVVDLDKTSLKRYTFLGLTQTCSQIRTEFRQLYMAQTSIHTCMAWHSNEVHFWPPKRFIQTFYALAEPQVMETYRGDLKLTVYRVYGGQLIHVNNAIQLIIVAPCMQLRFAYDETFALVYHAINQLNDQLNATADQKNTVWRNIVATSIRSIRILFFRLETALIFETDEKTAREAQAWWAEGELPIMDSLRVLFIWESIGSSSQSVSLKRHAFE